jgi:SAM-dependent methyltransferase
MSIRYLPPPEDTHSTVLDIGCGAGDFLLKARRLGYRVAGVEPDSIAARLAQTKGLDVTVGSLPGSGLPSSSFSHVTMNHVFEHMHDPVGALREIHVLLQPGGRLWLAMPNLNCIARTSPQLLWYILDAPRHLVLFTPDLTEAVLAQAGFTSVKVIASRIDDRRFSRSSANGNEMLRRSLFPRGAAIETSFRYQRSLTSKNCYDDGWELLAVAYKV